MLKTYYYWNNEVFTDEEELKDAIIDFISEYKNGRIMSMMDELDVIGAMLTIVKFAVDMRLIEWFCILCNMK